MYDEQEQVRMDLQWRSDDFEVVPENGGNQIQSEHLSEITAREYLIKILIKRSIMSERFQVITSRNASFFFRNDVL